MGDILLKKVKGFIREFLERADIFLLVVAIIGALYGIWAVHTAVVGMAANGWLTNPMKYTFVQVFSLFLGLGAFVVFTVLDSDLMGEQWRWLLVLNGALLVLLVIFGQDDGTGNKSWIRFLGIGVQPSEVIKVFYIVISAKQMSWLQEHRDINSLMSAVEMAGHFVLTFGGVIVVSSDLGSATILLMIFLIMFFALGVRMYWFALGGAAVAAMAPLLWTFFLKDYQKKRLIAPYDPSIDPDGWGITWQATQSKQSLMSGRWTGVPDDSHLTAFTGKHTDFIFASIGERLGMVGCIFVFIILAVIIVHVFRTGAKATRTFDMLLCFGVGASLAFQTFINIGMCIGITPVIGITLPLFSYGGSSMVTTFMALGLVSGVRFKPKPQHSAVIYTA